MVIDDEQSDQMMHERIMRKSGLVDDIIAFTYADEALAFLRNAPDMRIDGIFLDINMPRMTGIEFLEAVEMEMPHRVMPVVMILTTSTNPRDRIWAERLHLVRGFVSKPLTMADLDRMAALVAETA